MEHKQINDYHDLVQYGLSPLTGEACPYGMRMLFDLNLAGVDLIEGFLSIRIDRSIRTNFNSMVDGDEAIASILLNRDTVHDLIRFALFNIDNFKYVLSSHRGYVIGTDSAETVKLLADNGAEVYVNSLK